MNLADTLLATALLHSLSQSSDLLKHRYGLRFECLTSLETTIHPPGLLDEAFGFLVWFGKTANGKAHTQAARPPQIF